MTKNLNRFSKYFFVSLLFFVFLPLNAAKITKIKDVKLIGGTLNIEHSSYADIKFKKRIYNDPPRLVYDLLDSKLEKAGTRKFKLESSLGVNLVKVGQFDRNTVRVVCSSPNITSLEKVRVENIGQSLYFKFNVKNVVVENYRFEGSDLILNSSGVLIPRTIKLDNPERLVVDLIGAELKSETQEKKLNLPGSVLLRVAQFDDSIVRIVFAGKGVHKREVLISNNEKQIIIADENSDKKEKKEELIRSIVLAKDSEKETWYHINADKTLKYKAIRLKNPPRIVIDFIDIKFDKNLIPDNVVRSEKIQDVRFGIATIGQPVTRIVFDLLDESIKEEIKYINEAKSIQIKLKKSDIEEIAKLDAKNGEEEDPEKLDSIQNARRGKGIKVVLDPGHGGYDYGAIKNNYNEKDLTLAISMKVNQYLRKAGVEAYMTRTEDRFLSLAERVEVSNAIDPKIFVSVHINAIATNSKMDGLQTYYYSNRGYRLGTYLHKQLLKEVNMPDRKIRRARFWVTKYTKAPSVLLELGFITNRQERKKLVTKNYQNKLAKAIANGIINYLEKN